VSAKSETLEPEVTKLKILEPKIIELITSKTLIPSLITLVSTPLPITS